MISINNKFIHRYKQFIGMKGGWVRIMDDLISYNIDMYRDMLHIEIANNKELTNDYVLKLSEKLDKAIIAAYKEQLNTNNQ